MSSMVCFCFLSQHAFRVMIIHKSNFDASGLFKDFLLAKTCQFGDKVPVDSGFTYMSAYLELMHVHKTERPTLHDTNLLDIIHVFYGLIVHFISVQC